ncbi:transmembrane protein 256 homolog isoform X1 [Lingula anatina]|uniref:Transmembrane protein 256 homolog isoform X1 n=2 Tax=Lingula anatina TaxID=7574 RepID=A0A1S3HX28_LINAN|nr:transmembrane protein 256 homolog isoform X1 [Lingula anatina]|eukprot:XP_013389619.1 transmembrane protein 256 homolog isoform X1 [Lingula anatina]
MGHGSGGWGHHTSHWQSHCPPRWDHGYSAQCWRPPTDTMEVIVVQSPNPNYTDAAKEIMEVITKSAESVLKLIGETLSVEKVPDSVKALEKDDLVKLIEEHMRTGSIFVRVAGLSGALAVCMGAYGAHGLRNADPDKRSVYETANKYHLIHSLALLGTPLTRRPFLVGSLLCSGMLLFSGSCYYYSLTGHDTVRKVTPYGGLLLIAGWFAMAL